MVDRGRILATESSQVDHQWVLVESSLDQGWRQQRCCPRSSIDSAIVLGIGDGQSWVVSQHLEESDCQVGRMPPLKKWASIHRATGSGLCGQGQASEGVDGTTG